MRTPLLPTIRLLFAGMSIALILPGCQAVTPPEVVVRADASVDLTETILPKSATTSSPSPTGLPTATQTPPVPSPTIVPTPLRMYPTPLPTLVLPPQPAANFAFTFGYGSCEPITRVLDTFNNTLTQYNPDEPPMTVPFNLTDDQKLKIYQKMVAINFFSYPATFSIPTPDPQQIIGSAPYPVYSFTARNGNRSVAVGWAASISQPTSIEADNLRELITLLKQMIETHPDLAQLPPLNAGCA